MHIYIDGEYYNKEDAKVSVFDHGLLYGDGIFEGIRFYDGRVFKLNTRHTVFYLYGINLVMGLFAMVLAVSGTWTGFGVAVLAGLFSLTLLYRLEYITPRKLRRYLQNRRVPKREYAAPMITFGK